MIGKKTGQAAMEYLMTYGWALLVIVIVLAILLIMNPFSAPQSCRFDQIGFTCDAPALAAANSQLYLTVTNGNNNGVRVLSVNCTSSKSSVPPAFSAANATGTLVARQDSYQLNDSNKVFCRDASGAIVSLEKGADFSGKVWVFYRNEEDGSDYPVRSASANLVTKATG